MKTRNIFSMMSAFLCATAVAAPVVSGIALTQADSRQVKIAYHLEGGPAIVTCEIFTNGVSVGGQALWRSWGDVNVMVASGDRTIFWQPREWNDRFVVDGSVSAKVTAWALDNPPDYMAVDLGMPSNRLWYVSADFVPDGVTNVLYKTDKLLMRRIHAAGVVWRKDSTANEETGHETTEIMRPVMLTQDYYIGVFQMTCRQYELFNNPNNVANLSYAVWPKQGITYNYLRGAAYDWPANGHAVGSATTLGKLRTYTGIDSFDLPTDAQWDYACMGGDLHARFGVGSEAELKEYAWFNTCNYTDGRFGPYTDNPTDGGSGTRRFQRVGLLKPNPYGLYDMLGNGSELCLDWYAEGDDYAKPGELQIDPKGPATGTVRIVHACSVNHEMKNQRAGNHIPGMTIGPGTSSSYATCRLVCGISAE